MTTSFFPYILPNESNRKPIRPTSRGMMGQQVIQTRKDYEGYNSIRYTYDILSARQYRIIDNHFRSMEGGVTSFYVVDWNDPRPISVISGLHVRVNNVYGFSVNGADGGHNVILWHNSGDYGDDSQASGYVVTDTNKAWDTNEWANHKLMDSIGTECDVESNTSNTITVSGGTPLAGAYDIYRYVHRTVASINNASRRLTLSASPALSYTAPWDKFVLPVYLCHYAQDSHGLEPTGDFNYEPNDNYGPYYAGTIEFIQRGTGT